jgi:hypothetical protein
MTAVPLEHTTEAMEPELLDGLKLRRMRQLATQICLTARTQRWRPEEVLRVLLGRD